MSRDEDDFMDNFIDSRGLMSKSARDRWNRQQLERNKAILAECESGLMGRILARTARQNIETLDEGQQLDRAAREFINTMYSLLNESTHIITPPRQEDDDNMPQFYDAASTPYVSETQTRHAPMTGTHTHDHAAHGDPSHDDGIHGGDGPHTHENDSDHHHPDQHPHGHGPAVRSSTEGVYGRMNSSTIGPAERRRLRNQMDAEHERHR